MVSFVMIDPILGNTLQYNDICKDDKLIVHEFNN